MSKVHSAASCITRRQLRRPSVEFTVLTAGRPGPCARREHILTVKGSGALSKTQKTSTGKPLLLKRGALEGWAAFTYIPTRRGARHNADSFSRALFLAKKLRHYGEQFAWDMAGAVAALLPDCDVLVTPPPGRVSRALNWYFARELATAVSQLTGKPLLRPLRWAQEGQESSKQIKTQDGKGRALGRLVECLDDLAGQSVCVIDDLFTTGITAALTAEALMRNGAEGVTVTCLARTERTEHRPEPERAQIRLKAARRKLRKGRQYE